MADLHKMDRTWLCSVLFMDIANYSSQSVEQQMKWKTRFNGYLSEAIQDVPENERVIVDTGDGAAVCFLGAPEAAMFAALHLWQCFVVDERDQQPGLRVRIGVNLGPVKLVKDLNGSLNAIGDGINIGQRIMSFTPENQILVSQSFFDVVSRISDDYKALFSFKGVETDKHVREHTVYSLRPPGTEKWQLAAPTGPVVSAAEARPKKRSPVLLLVGGALVIVVGAAVAWRFAGAGGNQDSSPTDTTAVNAPVTPSESKAAAKPEVDGQKPPIAKETSKPQAKQPDVTVARAPKNENAPVPAPPTTPPTAPTVPTPKPPAEDKAITAAKMAIEQGNRLLEQERPAESVPYFENAIRANPNDAYAYLGRAQARRSLGQFEMSIQDCNAAMRINPREPRAYFCRGVGQGSLQHFDLAVRDYSEAIRLNPSFGLAYESRGNAHYNLQQFDRALEDWNQAIRLQPNNAQTYLKRAMAHEQLMQYPKAIEDYDQAIRIQPGNAKAYFGRAAAKHLAGDRRGAEADRRYAKQLKSQ
jgi:class 3 adenylate cyclase/Flp pilus assembly protein TadD